MVGLAAIFVVGIVVVLTGSHEKAPLAASATGTSPAGGATESPGTSGTVGSVDATFAPVGGFTFEEAPASVMSELRQGFEEGMKSELKPGVTVNPDEVLAGVSGRSVSRDGDKVALAMAMKFNDQWVAEIDSSGFLARVASELGATDRVTVGGTDAVYANAGGARALLAYKDGTFLIVIGDSGDRATLSQVMVGLIANMG